MEQSASGTLVAHQRTDEVEQSPDDWVERYGDLLYRVAMGRVGDRTTAEDLVQEAFLAAWKGRTSFDGRSARGTWLVAILKRKIADHFRAAGRTREATAPNASDDAELFDERGVWKSPVGELTLTLDSTVEREEFWQVMESCVDDLPGTLAQAFSLREFESLAPVEASNKLGISRKNLAVRLHRARLLLRRCLQGRWLGEREEDE